MTTTGNGNCVAVNDQVLINFTAGTQVNAGAARFACANNAVVSLNGSVTGATGGSMERRCRILHPNNTTLNATYTPTAAEIAAGSLTLTLSSTGNGTCLPVTSNKVITFTPAPDRERRSERNGVREQCDDHLGGSQVTGATGAVWSGGTGTYAPNNATLNAVYTPSAAERTAGTVTLTLTTVGNGTCNAVSATSPTRSRLLPQRTPVPIRPCCANNAVAHAERFLHGSHWRCLERRCGQLRPEHHEHERSTRPRRRDRERIGDTDA
jgi:hypothetical protein